MVNPSTEIENPMTAGIPVMRNSILRTRAIPERFCGGDSLQSGAISSVCTLPYLTTLSQVPYHMTCD